MMKINENKLIDMVKDAAMRTLNENSDWHYSNGYWFPPDEEPDYPDVSENDDTRDMEGTMLLIIPDSTEKCFGIDINNPDCVPVQVELVANIHTEWIDTYIGKDEDGFPDFDRDFEETDIDIKVKSAKILWDKLVGEADDPVGFEQLKSLFDQHIVEIIQSDFVEYKDEYTDERDLDYLEKQLQSTSLKDMPEIYGSKMIENARQSMAINQNDIQEMVRECVKKIVMNEGFADRMKDAGKKVGGALKNAGKKVAATMNKIEYGIPGTDLEDDASFEDFCLHYGWDVEKNIGNRYLILQDSGAFGNMDNILEPKELLEKLRERFGNVKVLGHKCKKYEYNYHQWALVVEVEEPAVEDEEI